MFLPIGVIILPGGPTEILRSVVLSVAVVVGNLKPYLPSRDKRLRN